MSTLIPDKKNSTTVPLSAKTTFTGSPSLAGTEKILIIIYSDTDSVENGHIVQFSQDGINWDISIKSTYRRHSEYMKEIPCHRKYFRVLYTNGSVNQTFFKLQVLKYRMTDFYHAVSVGDSADHFPVYKFGHIKGPSSEVWTDVNTWGNYTYDSVDTIMQVTSNNILEKNVAIVVEGVNSSGSLVADRISTHSTNATIPVSGTTPFYRVFRAYVDSSVVTGTSNFYVSKQGSVPLLGIPNTADRRAEMLSTENQTSMALFTVPKGFHMIVTDIQLSAQKTTTAHVEFMAQIRPMDMSKPWRTIYHTSLTNFSTNFSPKLPWVIPGNHDVRARCFAESPGIFVSAGWNAVVESD